MKHTKEQIHEKAIKVISDLTDGGYKKENIKNIRFKKEDELLIPKGKIIDTWTISIKSIFNNIDFLIISDETGEPLYYFNFNYIKTKIIKNADGIYKYQK